MEIQYNPIYAKKHLSIRVPWHDNAWNGSVCCNPKNNDACLVLKNCAENRKDDLEIKHAGKKISEIDNQEEFPPCISERAMFMSDFDFIKDIKHPYANGYNELYKNLKPTPTTFLKYSAPAIPFLWGMPDNAVKFAKQYNLDYDINREPFYRYNDPKLEYTKNWVQNYNNQKTLFDCFFQHIKPSESLSFFYAKEVPFIEDNNRVLIGIGEIVSIIQSKPFEGSVVDGIESMPWEHMVKHSIRPEYENGFLFPYHEALEFQKNNPEFDPKTIAVIIPNEFRHEFSYATEHVSHDFALYILRESIKKIELAKKLGIGKKWDNIIEWLSKKILIVKELRGDYPGFGTALTVFGFNRGYFFAQHILNAIKKEDCPWEYLDKAIRNTEILPIDLKESITDENFELWKLYNYSQQERLALLQLISRFNLSFNQAENIFNPDLRNKRYQTLSDKELIENPYLLYEFSIISVDPINYSTIDGGLFFDTSKSLLPKQTKKFNSNSKERIRALTIMQLEKQATNGHTLYPESDLIKSIADLPIEPICNLNADYFNIATSIFNNLIVTHFTADNKKAYQLKRYDETSKIINNLVTKRKDANKHGLQENWENFLKHIKFKDTESDKKAKIEKIKALEEMANSRFSVLIGHAGSGKTTLLAALASIPKIKEGNVLFLAPTGKAKVRMEEQAKKYGVTAKTIASFLVKSGRFKGSTQTYHLNNSDTEKGYKTVIIDECSMLTEEMLASTLQHLTKVERLILVGDYRQLPPIGAGRPFFDIINFIKPENIESIFPKVGNCYVELTASGRQEENDDSIRLDTAFANLFGGKITENDTDEIIKKVINGESDNIKIHSWQNENDFEKLMYKVFDEELNITDEYNFNLSIGANEEGFFNFNHSASKIEDWQLLSPVRGRVFGTNQLNRGIHNNFKSTALSYAKNKRALNTPFPFGNEEIVYGDKIINIINHRRKSNNYPLPDKEELVANGEIGIVVGGFKKKKDTYKGKPWFLEVEFSSQRGNKFQFLGDAFSEENGNYLELAYALTIHKAQGSQFKTVILVLPDPCTLLSRELIYTALTRQVEKVILLYQGNPRMLMNYTTDFYSASLQRITNLFYKPNISLFKEKLFEKNLIHCASDGTFLRSKSEVIIYELLLKSQLNPEYEYVLEIDGEIKRPDFYISDDDTGEKYYWEHLGMLNDDAYSNNWQNKLNWYKSKNILPLEDGRGLNGTLIITKDDRNGGISVKEIASIIDKVFGVSKNTNELNQIEALTKVVFELRDIIGFQFSKLYEQFGEIKKSSKENEEKIEKIYSILDEESNNSNIQKYYEHLEIDFKNHNFLEDNSKKFIASAYLLEERFEKSGVEDYAPFVLQFSRAIENELLNKIFLTYYPVLENELLNETNFLENEFNNNNSKIFAKALYKKSEKFTLGTMVIILSFIHSEDGKSLKSSELFKSFRKHILTYVKSDFLIKSNIDALELITNEYRNKAAHVESVNKKESNDFKQEAIKTLNTFLNSLK